MELMLFAVIFLLLAHRDTVKDKEKIGWKKGDKTKWWYV